MHLVLFYLLCSENTAGCYNWALERYKERGMGETSPLGRKEEVLLVSSGRCRSAKVFLGTLRAARLLGILSLLVQLDTHLCKGWCRATEQESETWFLSPPLTLTTW